MNLSFSEIVTSFTVWEFLSQLAKPFNQMDIYRVGIIDARGKFLKEPKDYETVRERTAGSAFNRLVVILKRALLTSADPVVRYTVTNPTAALNALAEEVESFGGNGQQFLDNVSYIFEDGMSVGGGGLAGVSNISNLDAEPENAGNVVVSPRSAAKYKKSGPRRRRMFEELLAEAKGRVVETTGHMTHLGDFLYYGAPDHAIKHLEAVHRRFSTGASTPNHKMSLKADGGMSIVLKRHKDGTAAVAYKSGAAEYTTPEQIHATGKAHLIKELIPALDFTRRSSIKPGTAIQGDLMFTQAHSGRIQPNAIHYHAPADASFGFAPHSEYTTDGLNLRKVSSHPDTSGLKVSGAWIPDLAITKQTKLSLHPKLHKIVSSSIAAAKKILANKDIAKFAKTLPSDIKFHRMLQEYSNHAARTTGERSAQGLREFIPVHMAKSSQKGLSDKTKKAMTDSFHSTLDQHGSSIGGLFQAHAHINNAKHALLDQFKTHSDQFLGLRTHAEEEHEGFVSSMGKPGVSETQAKFVREGPGGFPAKNTENAAKRFGPGATTS